VAPGEYLQLVVKDKRIGMPPEVMNRVFIDGEQMLVGVPQRYA
jgi:hypothetical protein